MLVSDDIVSNSPRSSDDHSPRDPQRPAQRAGCAARRAPGTRKEPRHQGARPGLARVRQARPGRLGAVRARVRVHHRDPDGGRAPAARDRRRRALCDRAPWTALEVPRCGLPGRGLRRRGAARRRHRGEGREAAGEHRRPHRGPDRPERGAGASCRRHARARRPAGPADAGVQLRARRPACQRHAAPAARAGEGPATGSCRAADHQVPRDPELVPGAPRSHRQRLQVLRGPARTRPHDELHPL